LAVFLFVGVSAGYAASVALWKVILPRMAYPLLYGGPLDRVFAAIALALGLLLLLKLWPRTARLGTLPLAFMTGVGAAVAIGGAVVGTMLPQTQAAIGAFGYPAGASLPQGIFQAFVMLVGTTATLVYFHFGAKASAGGPERSRVVHLVGWVGQVFVAGTFGALFAGVFTAALTALIQRWSFILHFLTNPR
jgi:hypothetical protein